LISELEERILAEVQNLPLTSTPFQTVAETLGLDEATVLTVCENMLERGVVKRFGVSLSHRRLGFTANPMTVLNVPEDRLDEVGEAIAREPGVTHCYARSGWDYNLFFMIHDRDRQNAIQRAEDIVQRAGGFDHRILFSTKELKKVSFTIAGPREMDAEGGGA
jgi:DNA-binding Lrp family transcriptional regulator